jgi:hypothetical protein
MVKAICKEILPNKDLLGGKLLCCPENGNCVPSPVSCSTANTLAICHKVSGISDCSSRTDTLANTVCQHKDGLLCAETQTSYIDRDNLPTSPNSPPPIPNADGHSVTISAALNRHGAGASIKGFNFCCNSGFISNCQTSSCSSNPWIATCDDFFASGKCFLGPESQGQTEVLNYQIEICDNSANFITSPPTGDNSSGNAPTTSGSPPTITINPTVSGNSSATNSSGGLRAGEIIGIIAGSIVLLGFLVFGGWKGWKYIKNNWGNVVIINHQQFELNQIRREVQLGQQGPSSNNSSQKLITNTVENTN